MKPSFITASIFAALLILDSIQNQPHKYTFMRWQGDHRLVLTVETIKSKPVRIEDSEGATWYPVQ